jgi:hypothetical protein
VRGIAIISEIVRVIGPSPPHPLHRFIHNQAFFVIDDKSCHINVLAATEAESIFALDPSNISPNLLMSNNQLSLRNATNKKWSTARTAMKMSSGLNRWDVHIDR